MSEHLLGRARLQFGARTLQPRNLLLQGSHLRTVPAAGAPQLLRQAQRRVPRGRGWHACRGLGATDEAGVASATVWPRNAL